MNPNDTLTLSGLDGSTGKPLRRPTLAEVAALAQARPPAQGRDAEDLRTWADRVEVNGQMGLRDGHDPCRLDEAGWGVIFAADDPRAGEIRTALQPLLELRRAEAGGVNPKFYRELFGTDGYQAGETARAFLARHRVGPGLADPHFMPYYLLLVGDPMQIPFSFQYQLDIEYAVGRLCFDTVEEYARYAASVVAAEAARRSRPAGGRAVLFGPANPDDGPTKVTTEQLLAPLAGWLPGQAPGWQVDPAVGDKATKTQLRSLLGGADTPDLLFTAGHGLLYRQGDARQLPAQGGLVCQEWPGHAWQGAIPAEHFLAAADIGDEARLQGLIAFCFACYSAGTPKFDDFDAAERTTIASRAFVAALPRRLLGHPAGGALAVIGHVERAWESSIEWPGAGRWIQTFEDCLRRLLTGHPVGSAMEVFGVRYAVLASGLATELEDVRHGKPASLQQLACLWTWSHDARNYAVLGDPAVRLGYPAGSNGR
jgi:hypothetical protein